MFTSGALEVNRHEFEDSRYMAKESHANELANLLGNQYGDSPIGEMDSQIPERQQLPPMQNIPEPTVELPPRKPPAGKWYFINIKMSLWAGSSKSELAKISELEIKKMCY